MNATSALHNSAQSLADSHAHLATVTVDTVRQIAEVNVDDNNNNKCQFI